VVVPVKTKTTLVVASVGGRVVVVVVVVVDEEVHMAYGLGDDMFLIIFFCFWVLCVCVCV